MGPRSRWSLRRPRACLRLRAARCWRLRWPPLRCMWFRFRRMERSGLGQSNRGMMRSRTEAALFGNIDTFWALLRIREESREMVICVIARHTAMRKREAKTVIADYGFSETSALNRTELDYLFSVTYEE